jgi:16S rRNA (cytosine1402-N4)-methyltransferase
VIFHQPVLLAEVLAFLVPPQDDGVLIDATLGEGGHAEAFLLKYPRLSLIGVDADASILEAARERLSAYSDRTRIVNAWFGSFFEDDAEQTSPDMILMDLGVSRYHFEASGRGFSFDRDETLDMRLGKDLPVTAADIINTTEEGELTDVLFRFGEERFARSIAARIVRERASAPFTSARRLANVVAATVPDQYRHRRIHPATRTFQALRIAVNRELEQLNAGLEEALRVLKPGGRIGVITFHSLEDRIVKRYFREKSRECTCPPEWPICQCGGKAELRLVTGKPVSASEEEVARNPASRSAKLRVAEKPRPPAPGDAVRGTTAKDRTRRKGAEGIT